MFTIGPFIREINHFSSASGPWTTYAVLWTCGLQNPIYCYVSKYLQGEESFLEADNP